MTQRASKHSTITKGTGLHACIGIETCATPFNRAAVGVRGSCFAFGLFSARNRLKIMKRSRKIIVNQPAQTSESK